MSQYYAGYYGIGCVLSVEEFENFLTSYFTKHPDLTEKEQEEKQKRPWKKEIREDTERESGSSKTGKIRLSDCGSLQISSDQPSVLRRR